jgi:hypothetical protein
MKSYVVTFILAAEEDLVKNTNIYKHVQIGLKYSPRFMPDFIPLVSPPGMFSVSARRHNIRIERKMSIQ